MPKNVRNEKERVFGCSEGVHNAQHSLLRRRQRRRRTALIDGERGLDELRALFDGDNRDTATLDRSPTLVSLDGEMVEGKLHRGRTRALVAMYRAL